MELSIKPTVILALRMDADAREDISLPMKVNDIRLSCDGNRVLKAATPPMKLLSRPFQ